MPRIMLLSFISIFLLAALRAAEPAAVPPNTLSDQEKKDGWILLFDGKNTTGWRQLGTDKFPSEQWVVRDGGLVHLPVKGSHDLVWDKPVESFELSWEWIVPKAKGNSGIKYRVQEKKGTSFALGCEYQMMNDPGVISKDSTGSLYDVFPPAATAKVAPDGQWNRSRVVAKGNHVEHWLNGQKVLEFDFWNDAFKEAVAKSKFKNSPVWAKEPKGFIVLTAHSDEAQFRNIKLRELK
jgi:hypothetical protein